MVPLVGCVQAYFTAATRGGATTIINSLMAPRLCSDDAAYMDWRIQQAGMDLPSSSIPLVPSSTRSRKQDSENQAAIPVLSLRRCNKHLHRIFNSKHVYCATVVYHQSLLVAAFP